MRSKQKIAIIGAGFVGLSAAYELAKNYEVTVFELNKTAGGLAIGFKEKKWKWSLEHHYHHLFTSDWAIRNFAKKIGHQIIFSRPKTSTYFKQKIYQLDSPVHVLKFSPLSELSRFRLGLTLLFLRYFPFWKLLEKTTTQKFILATMGEQNWDVLWKPLMVKKFGRFSKDVSASWFWARIIKRSPSLGYPKGGFLELANTAVTALKKRKVIFQFNTGISKIKAEKNGKVTLTTQKQKSFVFDKVICTLPTPFLFNVCEDLDEEYRQKYKGLNGLGAINLVLIMKTKFLKDDSYWLNVNDLKMNFLAVVEHTNFIDQKNYANDHILYVGNYLEKEHPYFQMTAEQLFNEYKKDLQKINPNFDPKNIEKMLVFKAPFAQPVIPINYSKHIPPLETPIKNLYLANMQQVYPWDRGTNYAVEIGEKIAKLII